MRNALIFLLLAMSVSASAQSYEVLDFQVVPGSSRDTARVVLKIRNTTDRQLGGVLCRVLYKGQEWGALSDRGQVEAGTELSLEGAIEIPSSYQGRGLPELKPVVSEYRLADLKVDRLEGDLSFAEARSQKWVVWVQNDGVLAASGWVVEVRDGDRLMGRKSYLHSLEPGRSVPVMMEVKPPQNAKAQYSVVVDPEDAVKEAKESNNLRRVEVALSQKSRNALNVSSISVTSQQLRVQSPARLRVTLANSGDTPVHRVPLFLRSDGEVLVKKVFYRTLDPDKDKDFILTFLPKKAGRQVLSVTLDEAPEDFKNRAATRLVHVEPRPAADLRLEVVKQPEAFLVGRSAAFEVRVENQGNLPAASCRLRLLRSKVPLASSEPFDLAAGAKQTIRLDWVPNQAGDQSLEMQVYAHTTGGEEEDENNRQVLSVKVLR